MSDTDLAYRIRMCLAQKAMSVSALERNAGLKKGAVQNIMRGKSKSPRIDIIQAIARALGLTVSELMGSTPHVVGATIMMAPPPVAEHPLEVPPLRRRQPQPATIIKPSSLSSASSSSSTGNWRPSLYLAAVHYVDQWCRERNVIADKNLILSLAEEIYEFSFDSSLASVDERFADWTLARKVRKAG